MGYVYIWRLNLKFMNKYWLIALISLTVFSCKPKAEKTEVAREDFMKDFIDSTVNPGDDFFKLL